MGLLLLALLLVIGHLSASAQSAPATPAQPGQAYFEFMLAQHLEAQGDAAAALEALKRAQAIDPDSAEIQAEMAAFHARQNNGEDAVGAAERALALDPANLEARRILGLVLAAWSESGRRGPGGRSAGEMRDAAIDHLTRILGTPSIATDLNLQMTLARLQLRAGHAERAIPLLENIVSQAPVAEPFALLGEARLAIGRTDEAVAALEQAAAQNPRHFGALGSVYERQGRWEEAAGAYERALSSARTPTRDLRLRWAAALLNVPGGAGAARARDGLKDFLMTSPKDARGLLLLSTANLRLGDAAGAAEVARQLLAIDPASLQALHALAAALVVQREFGRVVELLTPFAQNVQARAKGRESDAAVLLSQLAYAHSALGEHDRAVAILTTAVAHDPLNAPALNSLGYTLADRGERLAEAVGFIERALKIDPDNPSYLDSLGWALYRQGRVVEAEPPLRRAAEALPNQSVIQDHLGDVLARQGKHGEAVRAWERALAGDGIDIDRSAVERKIKDARSRPR